MASLQKGLRPDPTARPKMGGRVKQRVEVAMPNMDPRISPAASPVDTYSRPAAARGGDEFLALAQGLSQLNPALRAYAQEEETTAKAVADEDARFKLAGMTFDEATSAVREGRISEFESPWFKAAFMRQYGTRYALWRANERTENYANEFDRENGDLEGFLAEGADEDAQAFGNDEFFRAGYGEAYTRFADTLRAKHGEYQTGRIKEETIEGASARFLDVALGGISQGASPAAINEQLRGLYAGNKDLLFLSPKEQDTILIGVAERLAQDGHFDYVREILTSDRGGIGSIVNKSAVSADAYKVLRFAEGQQQENQKEALQQRSLGFYLSAQDGKLNEEELLSLQQQFPDVYSPETVASLIGRSRNVRETEAAAFAKVEAERKVDTALTAQDANVQRFAREAGEGGQLAFLTDTPLYTKEDLKNGQAPSRTMSADDLRKMAVNDYMTTVSAALQKERGESDEQRLQREVAYLTKNGVTYEQWENVLTSGYQNATVSALAGGDAKLFEQSYSLYAQLHSTAPNLAGKLVKDRTALDFYEAVRVGTQDMGLTPAQASAAAALVVSDPVKMQEVSARYRQDQILASAPNVANKAVIAGEMERSVRLYVGLGMTPDRAIRRARERVDATHTKINGRLVYTADRNTPEGFDSMAEDYLDAYVATLPEDMGLDADDVSLEGYSSSAGVFTIVDRETGVPIAGNRYVTVAQITGWRADREDEERENAAKEAAQESENRYRPSFVWTPFGDLIIGGVKQTEEIGAAYHPKTQQFIDERNGVKKADREKPQEPRYID